MKFTCKHNEFKVLINSVITSLKTRRLFDTCVLFIFYYCSCKIRTVGKENVG